MTDHAFGVQRSQVTDTFPITAADAVMMGRWRKFGLLGRPEVADRTVVDHRLGELGLDMERHRTLGELSEVRVADHRIDLNMVHPD